MYNCFRKNLSFECILPRFKVIFLGFLAHQNPGPKHYLYEKSRTIINMRRSNETSRNNDCLSSVE